MNQLEKDLLQNIHDSLLESTEKDWEFGSVNDWAIYAKRMKDIVKTNCNSISAILKQPVKNDE